MRKDMYRILSEASTYKTQLSPEDLSRLIKIDSTNGILNLIKNRVLDREIIAVLLSITYQDEFKNKSINELKKENKLLHYKYWLLKNNTDHMTSTTLRVLILCYSEEDLINPFTIKMLEDNNSGVRYEIETATEKDDITKVNWHIKYQNTFDIIVFEFCPRQIININIINGVKELLKPDGKVYFPSLLKNGMYNQIVEQLRSKEHIIKEDYVIFTKDNFNVE